MKRAFQRTWTPFPPLRWWLTTVLTAVPEDPVSSPSLCASGTYVVQGTDIRAGETLMYIKFKNYVLKTIKSRFLILSI